MSVKTLETVKEEGIFGTLSGSGHEQVVFCHNEATNVKAIIAIHNTVLRPGFRGYAYVELHDRARGLTGCLAAVKRNDL
jgi:glutamate dehydrogenase/leucine dehydrogenase